MRRRLTRQGRDRVGRVFEEHRGYVEALAVQHAGVDDAPDVVAEVGLRLCQNLNGLRDRSAIRTWIYRVTVSAARDLHRDRTRVERTKDQLAAVTSPADAIVEPDEYLRNGRRRDAFLEALNRLKSRDKQLICNTLEDSGVSVSNGADRVALSRARQRLREHLLNDPRLE